MSKIELSRTMAPVSPSFWKGFVDDVISAVSDSDIGVLLQHLDSIEPSKQFTTELKIDRKLPFLDICVQRTIEVYLSLNSHHLRSHKKSVAQKARSNKTSGLH